ncbi:sporulation transcriptional regulator SpoIIID [Mycoplasmatota bacterium]|nr:sporulation transcriptional regulator SpoIIID [Mycoplasmatota bacterium]
MRTDIDNRVLHFANIILKEKSTVRDVARIVGYSKSTVHKDLTERLKKIDVEKYERVRNLLEYNKNIRHIRGGMSTKHKYQIS